MATPDYHRAVKEHPPSPTHVHYDFGAPVFCPLCGYALTNAQASAVPNGLSQTAHLETCSLLCTRCLVERKDAAYAAALLLADRDLRDLTLSRGNILALAPPNPAHWGRSASELYCLVRNGYYPVKPQTLTTEPPQLRFPWDPPRESTVPHRDVTKTTALYPSDNTPGLDEPPEYDPQPRDEERQS